MSVWAAMGMNNVRPSDMMERGISGEKLFNKMELW
jgi:hypothetical protein